MMRLCDWIEKEKTIRATMSKDILDYQYFYRDPPRATISDPEIFFSPADGVLLYNRVINDPLDPVLQVKGKMYSLREIMQDAEYSRPSLVCGVFMTSWDVHVNRVPYSGNISFRELPVISSTNEPMLKTEQNILAGVVGDASVVKYMKRNQRVLNTIYSSALGQEYYVVQIADRDASVVTPLSISQGKYFSQCERFSAIRWGSQVDLIIPIGDFKYEFMQVEENHIEAGVDGLVKISR